LRVTICHCRFCQRATGSAYLVEPVFDRADFAVTSGMPATYVHRSDGSGKLVTIHFCAICATKLFLGFERFPDVYGVYGGTFDDPNWFGTTPETSRHIFLGVARHGTIIPPGVDAFLEHVAQKDGTPVAPRVFDRPMVIGTDPIDG
jgi:hypothetical protein